MKMSHNFLFFLLLVTASLFSCTKEKGQVSTPLLGPASPPPPPPPNGGSGINTRLIAVGNISQAREKIAVASAGNKIFFAGGETSSNATSSRVDIYDFTTNSWSTAELSMARSGIATVVSKNKIYFAGGHLGAYKGFSGRVDIYDMQTNTWATTDFAGVIQEMAGAAASNKVVLASGVTAHIYDNSTNEWSIASLSERPGEGNCCQGYVGGIAATAINNTIYFAGGEGNDVHKAIDIYNTDANTWSKSTLSEYKGSPAGIAVGNINYWAGGETAYSTGYEISSQVEMRNMSTGVVTINSLFQANWRFSAVQKNDTIVFFTGLGVTKNKFDIYAINSNKFSIGLLAENIEGAAIISVNNSIYVAGGKVNGVLSNQLRKLEF